MACLQITENNCRLQLFSEFVQTQMKYPTSLEHPNLKFNYFGVDFFVPFRLQTKLHLRCLTGF